MKPIPSEKSPSIQTLWQTMLRIRRVEEAIAEHYSQQKMRCPVHLSIGQEAIASGVCHALAADDVVFSNHRSHAHYLAKGGDLNAFIAELHGKASGCCRGRGGSMHLVDHDAGFWGSTPIVAGTVPIAVGAAWAASLQGSKQVTAVFFGDGCLEEGVMHEAFNFASLHRLPVVFVCENNGYSVYTQLPTRQPERPLTELAAAHGITTLTADGNNVSRVFKTAEQAINLARDGKGPIFIELTTYRWLEHCGPNMDDDLGYRPSGELDEWQQHCPVDNGLQQILAADSGFRAEPFEDELAEEIALAFSQAESAPLPEYKELSEYA